jgi:hypothetical protein
MLMGNIFKGDPIILMHGISPFECPETTKPPLDLPFPHTKTFWPKITLDPHYLALMH